MWTSDQAGQRVGTEEGTLQATLTAEELLAEEGPGPVRGAKGLWGTVDRDLGRVRGIKRRGVLCNICTGGFYRR